jgi:hypothetical protein
VGIINKYIPENMKFLVAFLFAIISSATAQAQKPTVNVGIFAPMYLDSLFDAKNALKFKTGIPKFAVPGIDFVHGAEIAIDSLKQQNVTVRTFIFDTRAYAKNLNWLIANKKLDSLHLIVGNFKEADLKTLANFALQKNIPLISATYPNDAGITQNPFTVIMNSTLQSHCEGIFSYLFQNHATDKLYLFGKDGGQETKVENYFREINEQEKGTALLPLEKVKIDANFNSTILRAMLDSTKNNVIVGGSLDEAFAKQVVNACYELQPNFKIKLIGMPNWEGFSFLRSKEEFKDFPFIYTTPYYNPGWDKESKSLKAAYNARYGKRATEMAFKGYESTKLFTTILAQYPKEVMSKLNLYKLLVFSEYNFKPVFKDAANKTVPDYFENKHIYFVQLLNGEESKLEN